MAGEYLTDFKLGPDEKAEGATEPYTFPGTLDPEVLAALGSTATPAEDLERITRPIQGPKLGNPQTEHDSRLKELSE